MSCIAMTKTEDITTALHSGLRHQVSGDLNLCEDFIRAANCQRSVSALEEEIAMRKRILGLHAKARTCVYYTLLVLIVIRYVNSVRVDWGVFSRDFTILREDSVQAFRESA